MSFVIVNEKEFIAKLTNRLEREPIKHAKIAVQLAADAVRNEAINSIARGSKSGATVQKYNPKRTQPALYGVGRGHPSASWCIQLEFRFLDVNKNPSSAS